MTDTAELSRIDQLNENKAIFYRRDCTDGVSQLSNEGTFVWDFMSNEIIFSEKWKNMLGYNTHELADDLSTLEKLIFSDELEWKMAKLHEFIESDADFLETEMRLRHKNGQLLHIRSVAFKVKTLLGKDCDKLLAYHIDQTQQKKAEKFTAQARKIIEMIARGARAYSIYNEIAHLYEARYAGMRCTMLELEGDRLKHGGAPSMPKAYCDAINGVKIGPNVGSCGASTFSGERVITENIATDPNWAAFRHIAMMHGMRSCWSEPVKSSTGKVLGSLAMYYDYPAFPTAEESDDLSSAAMLAGLVMERDHNQKRMRDMAFIDGLTGLHSRGYGEILLGQLIDKSVIDADKFAVIYLDLDNFKSINDNFGHDIGDIHLKEIARRLLEVSNDRHIISRLGGDEFCIVLPSFISRDEVEQIAKDYLNAISKPILVASRKFTQSASLGISLYPYDSNELKGLGKLADTALCYAKKNIKNSYVFYKPEYTKASEYSFKLEHLLRDAIANHELNLVYQAKTNIATGKVEGLEVLCRWFHPELGYVSPIEFIAIAERTGLITQLTDQIMRDAFMQFMAWKAQGYDFGSVAVNISPSLFIEPDFIGLMKENMVKTGISPKSVELEITESFSQTETESLVAIECLKAMGVSIAIDDFGQGYSCFASLRQMDIDVLKIDKLFINDISSDSKAELLVKSMIEMAHALGCKVIAEGIEAVEQLSILKELGCDYAQGYLLNRPTSPAELPDSLIEAGLLKF